MGITFQGRNRQKQETNKIIPAKESFMKTFKQGKERENNMKEGRKGGDGYFKQDDGRRSICRCGI